MRDIEDGRRLDRSVANICVIMIVRFDVRQIKRAKRRHDEIEMDAATFVFRHLSQSEDGFSSSFGPSDIDCRAGMRYVSLITVARERAEGKGRGQRASDGAARQRLGGGGDNLKSTKFIHNFIGS